MKRKEIIIQLRRRVTSHDRLCALTGDRLSTGKPYLWIFPEDERGVSFSPRLWDLYGFKYLHKNFNTLNESSNSITITKEQNDQDSSLIKGMRISFDSEIMLVFSDLCETIIELRKGSTATKVRNIKQVLENMHKLVTLWYPRHWSKEQITYLKQNAKEKQMENLKEKQMEATRPVKFDYNQVMNMADNLPKCIEILFNKTAKNQHLLEAMVNPLDKRKKSYLIFASLYKSDMSSSCTLVIEIPHHNIRREFFNVSEAYGVSKFYETCIEQASIVHSEMKSDDTLLIPSAEIHFVPSSNTYYEGFIFHTTDKGETSRFIKGFTEKFIYYIKNLC